MGYGLNSFVDFTRPLDILSHLFIGSEGTLGFVAEARFRTIEIKPFVATGLLIFSDLSQATGALTDLVATGLATIELMDAQSLRAAQRQSDCPRELSDLTITHHAALLVEFQSSTAEELDEKKALADTVFSTLPVIHVPQLTSDQETRTALWRIRKGLFAAVAEARPSGTSALLEDISVPVEKLRIACESLTSMFEAHGYEDSVIFGHAKDGNIHFMLNERFGDPDHLARYEKFTAEMVDLVLGLGGSLKAEHGTGRIMAPFVRRQFGDELYDVMKDIKALCDPHAMLSPGVMLSDDPRSYVKDLKVTPSIEKEVDRCVECGYCEPACPSKNITLTPRQRIVLRREMQDAEDSGNTELLTELRDDFEYDGVETCAVDGMCMTACPVDINTGDLVRRLRQESRSALGQKIGKASARNWEPITRMGGYAMNLAHALPSAIPIAVTKMGRSLLGDDVVPLYDRGLPSGGQVRPEPTTPKDDADLVFFSSCISTMFGPAPDSLGVTRAFLSLCERAGMKVRISENSSSLCCGTPWKSKGYSDGYEHMSSLVIPALLTASDGGSLPVVCDAASCTEGLDTMVGRAKQAGLSQDALTFVDVIEFAEKNLLPRLSVTKPVGSIVIHHTCSTSQLGIDGATEKIARFVANDVHVPLEWGCCAFAGDRGMLHPELTASATQAEAAEVLTRDFDEYVSANRTCEIGMTRATGHQYRHILEVLEEATR
jgi:D-lactate dehydrogenase